MSDPNKLREALDLVVERFETAYAEPPGIDEVLDAARDFLALLESDAIVIRRDAEGNWPEAACKAMLATLERRTGDRFQPTICTALLNALADSSKAPE